MSHAKVAPFIFNLVMEIREGRVDDFMTRLNSDGRINILLRTPDFVYILELKYNRSAEEALRQIEENEYSLPWSIDSRTVIEIGINYSSEKRRIDEWVVKRK